MSVNGWVWAAAGDEKASADATSTAAEATVISLRKQAVREGAWENAPGCGDWPVRYHRCDRLPSWRQRCSGASRGQRTVTRLASDHRAATTTCPPRSASTGWPLRAEEVDATLQLLADFGSVRRRGQSNGPVAAVPRHSLPPGRDNSGVSPAPRPACRSGPIRRVVRLCRRVGGHSPPTGTGRVVARSVSARRRFWVSRGTQWRCRFGPG